MNDDFNLCTISTFGWYNDQTASNELQVLSIFGWFWDQVDGTPFGEIVSFFLKVNRVLEIHLER